MKVKHSKGMVHGGAADGQCFGVERPKGGEYSVVYERIKYTKQGKGLA